MYWNSFEKSEACKGSTTINSKHWLWSFMRPAQRYKLAPVVLRFWLRHWRGLHCPERHVINFRTDGTWAGSFAVSCRSRWRKVFVALPTPNTWPNRFHTVEQTNVCQTRNAAPLIRLVELVENHFPLAHEMFEWRHVRRWIFISSYNDAKVELNEAIVGSSTWIPFSGNLPKLL
jgi:hypothetical protein